MGLIRYLLDSVILIDHLNGKRPATDFINKNHNHCAISVITRAEILVPYHEAAAEPVVQLLNSFPALVIDPEVADRAAALRREHKWKLPDAFQAALAHKYVLKLVTRNTRDFPPEKLDFVSVPY